MDPAGFADKELQPFKDEDGDLVIASFISCKAEVEQIVKLLKTLDASEKSDTIILLPAKKAIDYYVNKLKVSGIDCKVRATDLSEEVLLAILRLVILPDHPFVIRIVLLHFQNIERKFRTKVLPMFIDGGDSLVETLKRAGEDKKWQKRLKETLSDFVSTAEQLISNNVDSIVAGLSELSYEVKREIIEFLLASDDNLSARERVESALYSEETESDEDTEDTGKIEVMTMHSSKGLSKQLVIIKTRIKTY
ncbi:hypothetical protein IID62_08485 [candidate division KSB1 bacterium]|nr:hypothetical protein [candidate division KSB1 bacterium]